MPVPISPVAVIKTVSPLANEGPATKGSKGSNIPVEPYPPLAIEVTKKVAANNCVGISMKKTRASVFIFNSPKQTSIKLIKE